MIQSRKDLHDYLAADRKALGRTRTRPSWFDDVWRFEIVLRKCEYYTNCDCGILGKLLRHYYRFRKYQLGVRCGFTIPVNVFDKGLCLVHTGTCVVSPYARVGRDCRLHVGVNIGGHKGGYPQLGNHVYIGPGAKIFGAVTIADDVAIGANAVVSRSIQIPGISIGGIPAVKISDTGATHERTADLSSDS